MARLFVAAWPPEEVLDRIGSLDRPEVRGLRWTVRDQWHVTLRFLGDCDEGAVAGALGGLVHPPVWARMGPGLGHFGGRTLHVPVAGLDRLAGAVVRATAGLGRPPEPRPFNGHLTLARVARRAEVDLGPLAASLRVSAEWRVSEVGLASSRLAADGARYQVLGRFALGGV